jgi:CDP-4-dehydro-6-deoxyglucose reductase, E1
MNESPELRDKIFRLVETYYSESFTKKNFRPGITPIPTGGRVFDAQDIISLVDASLDFWLTSGRFAAQFEDDFSQYLGTQFVSLCNSGSSANLLALSALTSPELGPKRLFAGDEIITVATGFSTTVASIIQVGCIPVFVDIESGTYNVDCKYLEQALSPKTKALFLAHTLGNPFEINTVVEFCQKNNLWLIEDNCDALGTKYQEKLTGTFGDLATYSFYPAHHITMGEGGCISTKRIDLKILVESFRDWGRDCWCEPGRDNSCGKRFDWQFGTLPYGYDHKYVYSHLGYNLKITDMQAAVGVAQLKKLDYFTQRRKENWRQLYAGLEKFEEFFFLPTAARGSDPSWFGFTITIKPEAPFLRDDIVHFLEQRKIATRLLFGGNLIRHPAFINTTHRVVGNLQVSDMITERTFWVGVYPGLTGEMLDYVIQSFSDFINIRTRRPS